MREAGSRTRGAIAAAITEQGLRFGNIVEMQGIADLIRGVVERYPSPRAGRGWGERAGRGVVGYWAVDGAGFTM
jgi:hypothetical protein